ncbi:hypothetical protein PsorP6_011135 [Peronosclerospora sorghi]|uniref:Uncharacterized protein n=1 Tax=Peronosclerospora sorghi TaxID=230839 RepID=A0ACC0VUP3_9STRA|nr:hypothetical protein PsorP6_011135 [Peronosclerospora sorghi]
MLSIKRALTSRSREKRAVCESEQVANCPGRYFCRDEPLHGRHVENKTSESAFKTRELLCKTLGIIIEQIVEDVPTDMGKNVVKRDKAFEYANMA